VTPNELEGIKATNIAEFLRSTLRYNFKHVKKEVNWGYGFVHFEKETRTKAIHNRDED
ncbi:6807_t:CDS:2, partial [Rhizophagus irregularis]